ncbi:hypothetical protein B5M09_006617 [Aphanomyces astaci]|uniref:Uncharacterized protein n=1 Tax=Aphanomyces astaci TaxID=112090 RepID=A0A425D914_APHAT|nr:hypothetical protein B5M09_006617 [Aphanomyces astaci]
MLLVSTWFWWSCWWWAGLHRQADAVSIGGSVESTLASFHHPFLEILTPVNGQVAETTEVDIELVVREITMPSSFRGTKICLGIHAKNAVPTSNGDTETGLTEFCFDQTSSKVFHAQNLVAGMSYTVRVFLVDRGNVIAVSMRHFRVAAIAIPGHAGLVTILTALQHAVTLHDTDAAVGIYRRILVESPEHSHTLHLLGLTKLRAGRAMEAIPYLQQALRANATIEALHNTLGLCLKEVGRSADAAWHFEKALALRPSYVEARFNLGTLWQATQVYDRAIDEFRTLAAMVQANSLDLTVAHQRDVFVRLCGAYQGASRRDDALGCLNDALAFNITN